ncbi:Tn7 transposase TnsA N-terminal domain-containing protein [Roseobacter sinensis]|uniref:Tn7 transposase TnsA N-terminal domain-containing protein n=1 Tax=Roseobacter sinensis TaxID=2931391 RepID=UPI0021E7B501|nr:Tn7 transposase TnsA N-terminal domain-containing protein [Roseobacter sp. WL0113]
MARLKNGTTICCTGFESNLEWNFAAITLTRNDVADLIEQPFKVAFKDKEGRTRHHTFDYLVILTSGRRIAVAVKRAQKARSSKLVEDLEMIATQLPPELADGVSLFTDEHFEQWEAWNAHHFHLCNKTIDERADVAVLDQVRGVVGSISIGDLVRLTGLGGRAYQAIVRAIFSNVLVQRTKGRIGPATLVSPGTIQ